MKRMKILAVDDDQLNLAMIREILEDDYELVTVDTGEAALEVASSFKPDLILLDIMMPGIDGYETCRRLRANPEMKHVKIVVLSAKALTKARLKGYEVGIDDYVTKPFDENELLAKVRVYLRLKSVEELDRMKGQLLSLVAHEIRTPLTGILPAGEILVAEGEVDEAERRMWGEMILQNGRRLLSLAEKGMLLCQFRSGHIRLELGPVDFAELTRAVVEELDADARQKQIAVVVGGTDSLMIDGEARYLRTALESVLDNAITYSFADRDVLVELWTSERGAEFSVTNSGPGIDSDEASHVFDAFSTRKVDREVVGSGMSLAVARSIVQAHGGDMSITSDPGKLTTCSAWLPVPAAATVRGGESCADVEG